MRKITKTDVSSWKVLNVIRRCIIATDLVQFFKNKDEFKAMVDDKARPFNWEEDKCRNATMALAMTSCDLTSGNDTTIEILWYLIWYSLSTICSTWSNTNSSFQDGNFLGNVERQFELPSMNSSYRFHNLGG